MICVDFHEFTEGYLSHQKRNLIHFFVVNILCLQTSIVTDTHEQRQGFSRANDHYK